VRSRSVSVCLTASSSIRSQPDGHNWATAAFSTDYVDKGFRWQYSDRGRTYDWEGYNRLPDYEPPGDLQVGKFKGDVLAALTDLLETHLPYRQGFTDLANRRPSTLGRRRTRWFDLPELRRIVTVISAKDVEAAGQKRKKSYPDTSTQCAR